MNLPFFTERRRRKKPTQQEAMQNQFFSFLASFKEKSKGMKDLGMLEKYLFHSGVTLYQLIWTKGGKGRKEKGVVNLKTHFPQNFWRVIQTSLFKSL